MGRALRHVLVALSALAVVIAPLPAAAQAPPTLSIGDISVTEGNGGTVTAQMTVTKSGSTNQFVGVSFEASEETATFADADYHDTSGTLSFSPSETTETITVTIVSDTVDEADEAFLINLSNPSNATISDGSGRVTILDDDSPVTVSIGDASVVEGDSGTQSATFTVSLSRAVSDAVGVSYATSDGTATFASGDYHQTTGTISFTPGQTSRTITVQVVGDTTAENNETFVVTLSSPTGAVLGDSSGQGTITDNDSGGGGGGGGGGGADPTVSVTDQSVTEGNSGTTSMTFTVSLSSADTGIVRVDYDTIGETATEGQDFTSTSGELVFAAGETTKTVSVPIHGDVVDEQNETFVLLLPQVQGATFADSSGTGTIVDDDGLPILSIADVSFLEGDDGTTQVTVTLQLSGPSGEFVSVDLDTEDGTATFNSGDFHSTSGTLVFQPGQTQRTLDLAVVGDQDQEADEFFTVELSNVEGATLGDGSARVNVLDDDSTTKDPTTTTLTVVKRTARLVARGRVTPVVGGDVVVKLLKRRAGRFVLVQKKRPQLDERPGASTPHSAYRTSLRRPDGGRCRIVVTYPGSTSFRSSSTRATFRC